MKINFDAPILNLDGEEMMDGPVKSNMGKILGNALIMTPKGEALKFYDWALKLNKGVDIDIDRADQELLKAFIRDHEGLPIITKAQMLEKFTEQKESATT